MTCKLCSTDTHPQNFAEPRKCAFDDAGQFTPNNWRCATMDKLRDLAREWGYTCRDDDYAGSIGVIASYDGYIVMTWYKQRGKVGSAVVMADDEPTALLSLKVAEDAVAFCEMEYKDKKHD
jgi:hypothetical protein